MSARTFTWGASTAPVVRTVSGRSGRSAGGRKAKAAGGEFEAELVATHQLLAARGVPLAVARAHPPVVGNPVTGLRYSGKGQVDFVGAYAGRAIAFDAKNARGQGSYKQDPRDAHEITFLLQVRAAGGLAFLLIRDPELGRVYLVDDLDALDRGESVQLRAHARHGSAALVPCIEQADGKCRWDWTQLLTSEGA
jgi:penicillin-binding protein-related factor A (putative recombinase)